MRDRAACNGVAMRTLKIVYPLLLDIGCFSHTIDNAGTKFEVPNLSEFISAWISLFSHSPKARLLWKTRTGRSMSSYSATRWWSKWEVVKQVMLYFGDIRPFLEENDDIGPALRPKLLNFFTGNPTTLSELQVEIAAVVDWGEVFVKTCYYLEGDGPLALDCYEKMQTILNFIHTEHVPNVRALAQKLTHQPPSHPLHEQWVNYARQCVAPGLDYMKRQVATSLKEALSVFKACRLFSPQKCKVINPTSATLQESLSLVPFFDQSDIDNLKEELPTYLARADGVDENCDPIEWWKLNSDNLPKWSASAKKILLLQPSSATAERVFSLLKNSFGFQQNHALQDYIEASLMLQFNKR